MRYCCSPPRVGSLEPRNWQNALDAALYIHQISPGESLIAALAAFELGRLDDARTWFIHAVLNTPRAVAIVLGVRLPKPTVREEAEDHNSGVALFRSLSGYFENRSPASRRFFADLWKNEKVNGWRTELESAVRCGREDRAGKDRAAFDRMTKIRSLEFAQSAAGELVGHGHKKISLPVHLMVPASGSSISKRRFVH